MRVRRKGPMATTASHHCHQRRLVVLDQQVELGEQHVAPATISLEFVLGQPRAGRVVELVDEVDNSRLDVVQLLDEARPTVAAPTQRPVAVVGAVVVVVVDHCASLHWLSAASVALATSGALIARRLFLVVVRLAADVVDARVLALDLDAGLRLPRAPPAPGRGLVEGVLGELDDPNHGARFVVILQTVQTVAFA